MLKITINVNEQELSLLYHKTKIGEYRFYQNTYKDGGV
jgi:hypothetical protein